MPHSPCIVQCVYCHDGVKHGVIISLFTRVVSHKLYPETLSASAFLFLTPHYLHCPITFHQNLKLTLRINQRLNVLSKNLDIVPFEQLHNSGQEPVKIILGRVINQNDVRPEFNFILYSEDQKVDSVFNELSQFWEVLKLDKASQNLIKETKENVAADSGINIVGHERNLKLGNNLLIFFQEPSGGQYQWGSGVG